MPGERARTVTWWAAGRVSHRRRPRRLRPAGPGGRIAATGRDPTGLSLRRRAETDFAPPAGDCSSQLSRPREILSQAISVPPETWFPPSLIHRELRVQAPPPGRSAGDASVLTCVPELTCVPVRSRTSDHESERLPRDAQVCHRTENGARENRHPLWSRTVIP